MQTRNARNIVYIIVVGALARKLVHLLKVFSQARLLNKYHPVAYRFVRSQDTVEFVPARTPALHLDRSRRLLLRIIPAGILYKLLPYISVTLNIYPRIIQAPQHPFYSSASLRLSALVRTIRIYYENSTVRRASG
jgi:hypothetical protein